MIQLRSMLKVADNTGAKQLQVIHVYGGSHRKFGRIGDIVNAVVKQAAPHGQIKSSDMVKAVLVRSKKEFKRPDGSYIRFSENSAVIIDNMKDKNPKGTRIFGPIPREIRDRGFTKIASMAPEVL